MVLVSNMHATGGTEGMNCARILRIHYQEKRNCRNYM